MQNNHKVAGIALIILAIAVAGFCSGFIMDLNQPSSFEIDHESQDINNSIFKIYRGQIYASVPSNGEYPMPEADPASFRSLNQDGRYQNRQFAVDQRHAYCGNLSVAALNPATTHALEHNYFSDGLNTVYCAAMSQRNPEVSGFKEIKQTWLYGWGLADKPQTYNYQVVHLPKSTVPYRAILNADIVTNGQAVYYKGLAMPEANPNHLEAVAVPQDDQSIRLSHEFYHDQNSVFFKHHKLDIKSNNQLYSFYIDGLDQAYLFDPRQGQVIVDQLAFDPQNRPYQLLSSYGSHVNHAFFLSKQGVYFFDRKTQRIERAGDNPFLEGTWQEISPLIFSYNNQTYFLHGSSRRGGNKNPRLISRSTHLYQLKDAPAGAWQKVQDVGTHHFAEVWKKGEKYYYFDRLGSSQLIGQVIYEIQGTQALQLLLQGDPTADEIRKLTRQDQLKSVATTEVLKATTYYQKMLFGMIALPS
ncbi:DKNYY domain-containing protein [Acinetobacter rudis]|uniref:DKNYY family protein n=1 Tax=Acinetobacter rudis CIP 110305 TaxID=421052 RepID=S3NJI8_9GAMM|nr:DKNYY domain-containing protein [Acinetobacter rudis]EPF79827.1 hypothetical protein F945_00715 [Acinetobacter rudis CIP 110305]